MGWDWYHSQPHSGATVTVYIARKYVILQYSNWQLSPNQYLKHGLKRQERRQIVFTWKIHF